MPERHIAFGTKTLGILLCTSSARANTGRLVSRGWRALGRMHEGTLYWFWIGAHDEYQRLLKK
jgi:hypothetical protein